MKFHYDEEADVLYAFENGTKAPGIFDEFMDGIWIRSYDHYFTVQGASRCIV